MIGLTLFKPDAIAFTIEVNGNVIEAHEFYLEADGNVIDDNDFYPEVISVYLEAHGNVIDDNDFYPEVISVYLEAHGNVIERKTRLPTTATVFSPQKRDLHGLHEKQLIRINPASPWIDETPVPWWQRFHGMLEGDRLRPWAGHRGNF